METVSPENLEVFLGYVAKAVQSGQWALLGVLVLIGAVYLVRKFVGPKLPALQTGPGGALLNFAGSALAGVAATMLGGVPFTWALLGSVVLSLVSAGGFSLVKNLIPLLPWFRKADPAPIVSAAEKEGLAAAVAAKAPTSDAVANGP